MIVLFVFGLFVFFVDVTKAAQWVNNPANCATQSPGGEVVCQTSETPDSRVCGVSGVQYYCFSSVAVFSAPGYTQNNNQNRSGLGGGYIMDCEANDGVPPSGPFCDNSTAFWCNSDVTCNDKFRITRCSSSKWAYEANAFSCTDCISTRLDCSGDDVCEVVKGATTSSTVPNANYGNTCDSVVCKSGYENCNTSTLDWSDGCEIQFNVSTCTTGGGEPGVWTACGVCTALPPKYFLTASNTDYYSDKPLLWGTQLGNGDLVSFSNATSSNIFVVKNDASVFMSSTLATTTDKYFYNYNGDLYWGDMKLGTGGGVTYTAGSGLNLAGYEFTIDTSTDFNWTGQHTFNTTTTFPLGVWGADGRVGIGTTTPTSSLSLVVGDYDGITLFDATGQMAAGLGAGGSANAGLSLFNRISGDMSVSLNSDSNSYINNDYNFGIGTTTPDYKFTLDGDGFFMARGLTHNPIIYGYQGEILGQTGEGSRTFFYPRKSAFRSGVITDMSVFGMAFGYPFSNEVDQWDDNNIGSASFAANVNNKASGLSSAAFGTHNIASGTSSFVGGGNANEAAGLTSIVLGGTGNFVGAEGSGIVGGWSNTSTGFSAFIGGGRYNITSGDYSFIGGGRYNVALSDYSVAFGSYMTVSGTNSFGINLFGGGISSTLAQDNTFAVMGGNVGIGTTTPQHTLTLAGDFDIAENGLLKFNGISGSVDQVIKINTSGFPEWVDVDSLFINNTTFNSSTEFNSTSTFNSTAIFEGPSYFNNDVFVSGTISSTNLYVNGNSTTTGDLYVLGQAIFHDILPADNLAYAIGTSTFVWKEGWFGKIFTPEIDFTNNWKLSTTTDGGLVFTSSTQVALAILSTGQVGINTTTIEANLKIKVDGNIGSKLYCDVNGNNCFDPNAFGWATPQARYMNTTTANYNGNFGSFPAASGTIGYEAANHICSSTVGVGYHICQANEILDIIRIYGTSTFASKTNGWVANGPPGYVTVSTNDCEGYTTSTVSFYGAWWKFNDSSGGGSGKMTNCSTLQPIACCK